MDFGLILDVETTGINPDEDRIIEIGILEFGLLEGRDDPEILNLYGALEDPGLPLSPEIQRLTGLSDAVLSGQRISWDYVRGLMQRAAIVVAHNADFDRSFIERRPELADLKTHWACTMKHIDWEGKGFKTRALNYLAADHGFINPFAHRALFDCATTFRLMSPYFPELVQRSYLREVRVFAVQAAFEMKDKLRNNRYRWDAQRRCWFKDILEDALEVERSFLQKEIYQGLSDLHEETWLGANAGQSSR